MEEVFCTTAHTIYHIWIDGKEEIKTTAYHPVYIEGQGWVTAINLREGDAIETMDGMACITKIVKERYEEPVPVYNFHVKEWTSYFVGKVMIYVHNTEDEHIELIKLTAGKNIKSHYKDHKGLLEKLLGKEYPKFKQSNNAEVFLNDLSNLINSGRMKYVYKSTAQKNGDILKIYKGDGLVVATKLDDEWVTLLEDGKGMALQFEQFKILK